MLMLRRFPVSSAIGVRGFAGCSVRRVSFEAGDHLSGHILAGPNEGILFFDSVFPFKLRWLLRFPFLGENYFDRIHGPGMASIDPEEVVRKAFPKNAAPKVNRVIPRLKDGGAFVRFTHDSSTSADEVASKVEEYLEHEQIKPWWNPFHRVRTHLVRGRPWIEDLYRPPSCRLKVEFVQPEPETEATELSQEQLFGLFRPYGKLLEITSQPQDSKILPKYAYLDFAEVKRAVMAKNCLHGFVVVDETAKEALARLKLSYEQRKKANWISDWLFNHPRIVIPILAGLVAAFTVAIFDPIRTFFIKAHITRAFHVKDNRLYQWFVTQATDLLPLYGRREKDPGMEAIWDDRRANIEQIQKWLMETEDTFIIVQGPRGSGKRELVLEQSLKDWSNKLVIDCKPLQEARTDSALIDAAAHEVGYRPVFSWMNSMSGLIDLAAQGATGMKTGFSETVETQLTQILNSTAAALKEVGLEGRTKSDQDPDVYLEAHPECRPVVVIDNFLHKSQESSIVYDKLAEWAAQLTTANVAHVIFLTTDVSYSKSLSKALPDRVFRQLSLGDCSPEVAKRFVVSHLDADTEEPNSEGVATPITPSKRRQDIDELDDCISYLGGRLTDLEFLARRIKAGESPKRAVQEVIDQSSSEIMKLYILGDSDDRKWTSEQAWIIIKELGEHGTLPYNEILLSEGFKADDPDAVMLALEQAELINVAAANGRPYSVKPGKPVYLYAFRKLREDKVLASRLDLSIVTEQIKQEAASIEKGENELKLIGQLPKQPPELIARVQYLLQKAQASQAKIEKLELKAGELKKILLTSY